MRATGRRPRPLQRALAVAATASALSFAGGIPALAATSAAHVNTPRTHCRNAAGAPRLDPYGAPACADATNIVQERYEAGIAGAGLIVFVGGTLVYRRKRIIRIRSQTRPV